MKNNILFIIDPRVGSVQSNGNGKTRCKREKDLRRDIVSGLITLWSHLIYINNINLSIESSSLFA